MVCSVFSVQAVLNVMLQNAGLNFLLEWKSWKVYVNQTEDTFHLYVIIWNGRNCFKRLKHGNKYNDNVYWVHENWIKVDGWMERESERDGERGTAVSN